MCTVIGCKKQGHSESDYVVDYVVGEDHIHIKNKETDKQKTTMHVSV